jgi:hypothetical protein
MLLLMLPFMPCLPLLLPRLQAYILCSRVDSRWAGAAATAVFKLLCRPQPLLLLQLLVGLLLGRLWHAAAAARS